MSYKNCLILIMAAFFLFAGCSDQDNPTTPNYSLQNLSVMLRGDVPGDLIDFEFAAKVGDGIDDEGSLFVRGRNMAYDAEKGAMAIDLSVFNGSESSYPEPVGLTFMQFMPEGVTILESDNDMNGVGATILFEFDDEDLSWSPGEESKSRTVHFVIGSGTSLGFVARIDAGLSPQGGTIGGLVWNDMNEDGVVDPDENGVGGVQMALHNGDDLSVTPLTTVMTNDDGTYRFPGQDAGYYTVVRLPMEGLMGTTPAEMAVILVEMDGTVSDFLIADFGVKKGMDPGDDFVRVGDYVEARGDYMENPDRLASDKYKVKRCDGTKHDDDDDDHGCRQNECWGRFSGPMTDFSWDEHYVEIMGTKVYGYSKSDWDHDDWHRGYRIRLDVTMTEDGKVRACKNPKKAKKYDEVRGYVQEVVRGDDGWITGVMVLNTLITFEKDNGRRD